MTDEQFMAFRRRCNKVSYNLRKNQYAQLLSVKRDRSERRISELEDTIKDKKTLHWNDKYGKDAIRDEGEEKWSVEKANLKARERVRLLAMAQDIIDEAEEEEDVSNRRPAQTKRQLARQRISENVVNEETTYRECVELEKQYKDDSRKLVKRTVDYLKNLGLIETEDDIERLATLNQANQNPEVSKRWIDDIQQKKMGLDSAIQLMQSQRKSM